MDYRSIDMSAPICLAWWHFAIDCSAKLCIQIEHLDPKLSLVKEIQKTAGWRAMWTQAYSSASLKPNAAVLPSGWPARAE